MGYGKMVHNLPNARAFNGAQYDAVWMIPQVVKTNRCYLEIITRAPVYEVPHLWSPLFLDEMAKNVKEPFKFGYEQGQMEKMELAFPLWNRTYPYLRIA